MTIMARSGIMECLVLTLQHMPPLLLPFAVIAEITATNDRRDFRQQTPDMENWLVGYVQWRGVNVPLISFETACGFSLYEAVGDTGDWFGGDQLMYLAILHRVGDTTPFDYIALIIREIPRTMRLAPKDFQGGEPGQDCIFVHARVKIKDDFYVIPDLEKLERSVGTQLRWAARSEDWADDQYA